MAVIIDGGSATVNVDDKANKVTGATASNLASLTVTGDLADSGYNVLDQDDLSSNSDTSLATQQSIKAYVDANAGAGDVGDLTTTGLTPTNYLRIANPSGLEERTPAQTLSDIGAEMAGAAATVQSNLTSHTGDTSNPHSVTAAQVSALPLAGGTLTGGVTVTPSGGTALTINPASGQIGLSIASTSNFPLQAAGSGTALQLQSGSTQTNTVIRAIWLRGSGGSIAAGYGLGINFDMKSSTTADTAAARINVLWNDATHASRKADMVFTVCDTAEREGLRIRANGAVSAISFHGATPQPQSTGWAVTNVTPDKTFDANSTSIDELADVLGTLITYLLARGDLGA